MIISPKSEWLATHYDKKTDRLPRYSTVSDMEIEPLYTPEDLNGAPYEERLGHCGEYPYTRGVHASMYRGRLWTMRQFAGFGTAEDTNGRFRFLLEQGRQGCRPLSTCPPSWDTTRITRGLSGR